MPVSLYWARCMCYTCLICGWCTITQEDNWIVLVAENHGYAIAEGAAFF